MAKPLKIAIGTIMLIVSGLIGYLAIGFLFFSYSDSILSSGCEGEFCIEHSKAEVEALFEKKYSFDSGVMVPYDPTLKTSEYISTNTPNTFDELRATDRWTIVYDETRGWRKFVHLKFRDDVIYQIDVVDYGPFYMDP